MNNRPASDIALTYGSNTVWLRPSLRAATVLECMHGGFVPLLQKVQQGHTETLREIVQNSATDRAAARNLLNVMKGAKLIDVQQVLIAPAFALIGALMTPDHATGQAEAAKAPSVAWAALYADAYKIATGWLGWTPETAWSATLPEIMRAFDGHIDQLKAIHGSADEGTTGTPEKLERTAEQRQANIDAGLDPEFDREGLRVLIVTEN
ncbi:hypothetical protein [Sulfitobacter sp.]|uniref:hypothetical protein n=1 Tax=Sulfitobacter sp. TaxID=1903071 RepID=UPI0032983041